MTAQGVIAAKISEYVVRIAGIHWPIPDDQAQFLAAECADALTAAGYAIVHLPKPVHMCDRDAAWMAEDDDLQIDFDRRGGIAMAYIDSGGEVWGPWTVDQARQIAAALLAAAAHAERVSGE